MQQERAEQVVEKLREWGVPAHLKAVSPFQHGIRVVLNSTTEALWDTDGAAGLEAQIMRDGVLVGFIPPLDGSEDPDLPVEVQARMIAKTDYPSPT